MFIAAIIWWIKIIKSNRLSHNGPTRLAYLVGDLEVWKERYIPGPLDGTKQQPGGQLADVLDAHEVAAARLTGRRRHERAAAAAARRALTEAAGGSRAAPGRVRLGPQQHRHEARQVAASAAVTHRSAAGAAGGRVPDHAGRRNGAEPGRRRHHARAAVEVVVVGRRTVEHLSVTESGVVKARRYATFLYRCAQTQQTACGT